jgi:hypothetical protein
MSALDSVRRLNCPSGAPTGDREKLRLTSRTGLPILRDVPTRTGLCALVLILLALLPCTAPFSTCPLVDSATTAGDDAGDNIPTVSTTDHYAGPREHAVIRQTASARPVPFADRPVLHVAQDEWLKDRSSSTIASPPHLFETLRV